MGIEAEVCKLMTQVLARPVLCFPKPVFPEPVSLKDDGGLHRTAVCSFSRVLEIVNEEHTQSWQGDAAKTRRQHVHVCLLVNKAVAVFVACPFEPQVCAAAEPHT